MLNTVINIIAHTVLMSGLIFCLYQAYKGIKEIIEELKK